MTDQPILQVTTVSRDFGKHRVLDQVDLIVERGEIHAVLGPNGAGKTTLLRIIAGTADPSSGLVIIAGSASRPGEDREQRRRIGLIPAQAHSFYMRLSGLENLLFFARIQGLSKGPALVRARDLLTRVGLEEAQATRAGLYSTGMLRRLTIARALLVEPPVILVDEATMGLDPEGSRSIRDLFVGIAREGAAVVWTTQRIDEIRAFADQVTFLHEGSVRFAGSVPELIALARPRHYVLQIANGSTPLSSSLEPWRTSIASWGDLTLMRGGGQEHFLVSLKDEAVLGDAISALAAAGCRIISCREDRSGIEEAFLALTARGPG